jgi:hypothetical protein
LLPIRQIQQHHGFEPLGPNHQQVGGVWFGFTRGTNLNLMYFDQLKKKSEKPGYV